MSTFEIVRGAEGDCLLLDDTRISGPKPWSGGTVTKTFHTNGTYAAVPKDELDKLKTENAKLLELVTDLREYIAGNADACDFCTQLGTCENHPAPPPCKYELTTKDSAMLDFIADSLRELGIEVGE
jgi:hypothetical protein